METRINETDNLISIIAKMAEGNPGAMNTMVELFRMAGNIDPDSALRGLGPLFALDGSGIYGTAIYVLHNDICQREHAKTIAVLRAVNLGMITKTELKDACSRQDFSGRDIINVQDLYDRVKAILPNFHKSVETESTL